MNKIVQLLLTIFFLSISITVIGQQKYAVIVGINKYYMKPGVVHTPELHGCVNDALAIKSMLMHRFGFTSSGITILLDEQATKQNVLDALMMVLNKCHSGDAVLFYFSGHGVWMSNPDQNKLDDVVKQNMDQAMVMSNLYADSLNCLFTDATVKRVFNKFVDKQVIVTTILDCCFSGKMSMDMMVPPLLNPYYTPMRIGDTTRSIDFNEIYYNSLGYIMEQNKTQNGDSIESSFNTILKDELLNGENTRSFNLKDAIKINDPSKITRPSERPNSMFLSLGGTNDLQEGLEITDETNTRHGAFTKALLQTIKNNPSDITVAELIQKDNQLMAAQNYLQNPMSFHDSNRLHKNFIGIAPQNFSNIVITNCIGKKGNTIILDAGLNDGLANGNLLSAKHGNDIVTIKIINAKQDSSTALIIKGNTLFVNKGDKFELTDGYTKSVIPPVLKLFIDASEMDVVTFENFFNKKIIPLTKLKTYLDYGHWFAFPQSRNLFYNDQKFNADKTSQPFLKHSDTSNFLVFLPLPKNIFTALKIKLQKNQNIQLVKSIDDADFVLYMNYVKPAKDKNAGFVFTWYNFKGSEINQSLKFNPYNVKIADVQLSDLQLKNLTENISSMLTPLIRTKSNQWLNDYPLR